MFSVLWIQTMAGKKKGTKEKPRHTGLTMKAN